MAVGLGSTATTETQCPTLRFTRPLPRPRSRGLEAARQKVLEHWNAYATSGEVAADIQEDVTAVNDASQELPRTR